MFGMTVHDAGRLHPDAARLMIEASADATRMAEGVREAVEADRQALAASTVPLGLVWGESDRIVAFAGPRRCGACGPDASSRRCPAPGTCRSSSALRPSRPR